MELFKTNNHDFLKKSFLSFSDKIHNFYEIKESARRYYIDNEEESFIHFNYIDPQHFLKKLNRYTTIEAKNIYEGKKRDRNFLIQLLIFLKEFISRFIKNKGYKDKEIGFYISLLMVCYRVSSYLKLYIMKKYNTVEPSSLILKEYQDIANKVLEEYIE